MVFTSPRDFLCAICRSSCYFSGEVGFRIQGKGAFKRKSSQLAFAKDQAFQLPHVVSVDNCDLHSLF